MSLYHEAAAILTNPEGGSLKSRVFSAKNLKSPPAQVYALALETCKWSAILKEVVDSSQLLNHERKVCFFFFFFQAIVDSSSINFFSFFFFHPMLTSIISS